MAPFRKKPDFKRDRRRSSARRARTTRGRAAIPPSSMAGTRCEAALANPNRRIRALYATENAAKRLAAEGVR